MPHRRRPRANSPIAAAAISETPAARYLPARITSFTTAQTIELDRRRPASALPQMNESFATWSPEPPAPRTGTSADVYDARKAAIVSTGGSGGTAPAEPTAATVGLQTPGVSTAFDGQGETGSLRPSDGAI